jgi:hypothetical protein
MTQEVVIISEASRQIVQLAIESHKKSSELLDQFLKDLTDLQEATLKQMDALIAEEPELMRLGGEDAMAAE